MTYNAAAVSDTVIAFRKPITLQQGRQLRDNPLAMFEGLSGAPRLKDAALDTGAATAAGTTWVGLRTAGLALGSVGSYAFCKQNTPAGLNAGSVVAGSNLRYTDATGSPTGAIPAGSWRLMGDIGGSASSATLVLRIS